ncbi:hypothetical protein [Prolixibacter denitrificans]|nr:hypothetical protein [Prolixibacter denitrificans]
MRMKYSVLTLLFMAIFVQTALAEEPDSLSVQKPEMSVPLSLQLQQSPTDSVMPHDFGVEVGTSVFTNFKHGYGFNQYVAPRFSFSPSKRWRVDMLGTMGVTRFEDMPLYSYYLNEYPVMSGRYYYASLLGQATYAVNEKLFLGGTGFVSNTFQSENELNPAVKNLTNYGSSLFVGYKFSDKFSMQAEFSISKVGNPYNGGYYNTPGGYPQTDYYRTSPVSTDPMK